MHNELSSSASKRKFLRPAILGILGVLVLIVLAWSLFIGYHVYDLSKVAKGIQQQNKFQLDYDWATAIHRINGDVSAIQGGLSPLFPVFHLFPDRPGLGHLLRQVEPFTRYSVELSNCAELLFNGIQPVIMMMQDKSVPTDQGKIISSLSSQSAVFHQAQIYYQSAADIRPDLDPTVLPLSIKNYYDKLDANFDMLGFGLDLFQALPGLTGQDQSKVYFNFGPKLR